MLRGSLDVRALFTDQTDRFVKISAIGSSRKEGAKQYAVRIQLRAAAGELRECYLMTENGDIPMELEMAEGRFIFYEAEVITDGTPIRYAFRLILADTGEEVIFKRIGAFDADGERIQPAPIEQILNVEEEKKAAEERNTESREFLDFVKESLGEEVAKVRLSGKLASQPCALTTDGGITLEMEKYFSRGPSEEMRSIKATRVLELNPDHKAVKTLQAAYESGDKDKAAELSKILNTLAKMMAGVPVEDPAEFTRQVSELF